MKTKKNYQHPSMTIIPMQKMPVPLCASGDSDAPRQYLDDDMNGN